MNKDLTVGKVSHVLWKFCLFMFAGIIFQQIYNIADSLVAGKYLGEKALAAVGNSYEITLIFIAFAFGCNIACSVVVSMYFGGKRYKLMKTTVYTTLISTAVICLILVLFGLLFGQDLLQLINTPEDIFQDSWIYLRIYIFGLPFIFFYNVATGIFSALGDSKTPFIFLAVSSLSNIVMDIFFVRNLGMGVDGVAWATFICQGFSCISAFLLVMKRITMLPTDGPVPIFNFSIFKQLARIALPSIMQQSFISVGNIIIQSIINNFGSAVIAGYSAAIKLNNLVITAFTSLGNGISNFTAQNLGAEKPKRIVEGFKAGCYMVWSLCLVFFLAYFFAGRPIISFFMDQNATDLAISTGITILTILSPLYFVIATKLVADGILRGSGMMRRFMYATFIDLIIRVTLAWFLSTTELGATGIWLAWPIGWTTACILSVYFYRQGPWRESGEE